MSWSHLFINRWRGTTIAYCSCGDNMFGRVGADVMVHLPSLANRQPEEDASYEPSYLAFISRNSFLRFFSLGRLIMIPVKHISIHSVTAWPCCHPAQCHPHTFTRNIDWSSYHRPLHQQVMLTIHSRFHQKFYLAKNEQCIAVRAICEFRAMTRFSRNWAQTRLQSPSEPTPRERGTAFLSTIIK